MPYRNALAEIKAELFHELGKIATEKVEKGKQLPAVPSREEVRTLMTAPDNERDSLIIRVFYSTGVRVGEAAALRYCHLQPDTGCILVLAGKEHQDRYMCADPETMDHLMAWQAAAKKHGGGRPQDLILGCSTRQLDRIVVHWGRKVGLVQKYRGMKRSFSPYSLRHAYATHNYEDGMDLFTLKKLMGHRFLETTEIYIQTAMSHTYEVYMKTNELARDAATSARQP